MIIAQLSDTHILSPESKEPEFTVRADAVQKAVVDINNLPERPDVVIHTGDLAQNRTRAEYEFLNDHLSALAMPYYVVPGNRDDADLIAGIFPRLKISGEDKTFIHYCIDDYPVALLALDTRGLSSYKGNFPENRHQALRNSLDRLNGKPAAMFMHHPPFDVINSREPFQYETRDVVQTLEELLSNYPNIIRIFCGHSHRARLASLGTIPASTTPSTAPDLRLDDYPPWHETSTIYQTHAWDGSRGFVSTTRWVQ